MFQWQDQSPSSGLLLKQAWRWGAIVKTLQMIHHHYTVKDKAQEAVFLSIKIHFLQIISRSPKKGDTSQKENASLVLLAWSY